MEHKLLVFDEVLEEQYITSMPGREGRVLSKTPVRVVRVGIGINSHGTSKSLSPGTTSIAIRFILVSTRIQVLKQSMIKCLMIILEDGLPLAETVSIGAADETLARNPEPYGFTGPSGLFAPLFLKMLESQLFRNECYCDE